MNGYSKDVKLLGTSFSIKSNEDPSYIDKIISIYKERLDKVELDMKIKDPLKISIITGFFLVDELLKAKDDLSLEDISAMEKMASQIINKLDNCIK